MKSLPQVIIDRLNTNLGTSPYNLIKIGSLWFADKDVETIDGAIISLGEMIQEANINTSTATVNINCVLDDKKGLLKNLIDSVDVNKLKVQIYQAFDDLAVDKAFLLFEGVLNTPISWDEGTRQFSFDVMSNMEQKDIGWSLEEARASFIPPNLIGKPVPLVFGTCYRVPSLKITEEVKGILRKGIGITDPSIEPKLAALVNKIAELYALAQYYSQLSMEYQSLGDEEQAKAYLSSAITAYNNMITAQNDYEELNRILVEQNQKMAVTISVENGENFPSGQVTIKIGKILVTGVFSPNGTFYHSESLKTKHPDYAKVIGNYASPEQVPSSSFYYVNAGEVVEIYSNYQTDYLVSLPAASSVLAVYAKRSINDVETMFPVPPNSYQVLTQNLGGINCTILRFPKALRQYNMVLDEDGVLNEDLSPGWSGDEIWVDLVSSVGPNTVDEMEWIIQKFTNLTIDSTSFNYVKTKLQDFPSHFALFERKNAMKMLEEMAWQCRCAIYTLNGKVYLKYLSYEESSVRTLTDADIREKSIVISTTPTEDLVTKLVGTWKHRYDLDYNKTIVRNNVNKYGIHEEEYPVYIYSIEESVIKTLTFWIIRWSNLWKRIQFNSFLKQLQLDIFDTVILNIQEKYLGDGSPKCIIESMGYNTETKEVSFECWTPYRVGERKIHPLAYPGSASSSTIFASDGGSGPGSGAAVDLNYGSPFKNVVKRPPIILEQGEKIPTDFGKKYNVQLIPQGPNQNISRDVAPSYSFQLNDYTVPVPNVDSQNIGGGIPGKVLSGTGKNYSVALYKNGLNVPPVNVFCQQLQINAEEQIPAGTWTLVTKVGSNYYMQVPIWL